MDHDTLDMLFTILQHNGCLHNILDSAISDILKILCKPSSRNKIIGFHVNRKTKLNPTVEFEVEFTPLFKVVTDKASFVEQSYHYTQEEKSIDKFMNVIKEEKARYDDLICNFYEECIILFDKGVGSET